MSKQSKQQFWLVWIAASLVGGILGSIAGPMAGALLDSSAGAIGSQLVGRSSESLRFFSVLLLLFATPLLSACAIGLGSVALQIEALRHDTALARAWLLSTMLGWAITGCVFTPIVGMGTIKMQLLGPLVLLGTLLSTVLQLLFLSRHSQDYLRMTSVATFASILGWVIGFSSIGQLFQQDPFVILRSAMLDREIVTSRTLVQPHVVNNQLLFFTLVDMEDSQKADSWELWRSDGSAQGSMLIGQGAADKSYSEIQKVSNVGQRLLFQGFFSPIPHRSLSHGETVETWQSDGSQQGTHPLILPNSAEHAEHSIILWAGNQHGVYYLSDSSQGCALWYSQGSTEQASLLQSFSFDDGCPCELFVLDQQLIFARAMAAPSGPSQCEIWSSMGSAETTQRLARYTATDDASCMKEARVVGTALIWHTSPQDETTDLWLSRGSTATTYRIASLDPQSLANIPVAPSFNPRQSYLLSLFRQPCYLLIVDSVTEKVAQIAPICAFPITLTDTHLIMVLNHTKLVSRDAATNTESTLSTDMSAGQSLSEIDIIGQQGDTVFLRVKGNQQCLIWKTNGTAAGTERTQLPCVDQILHVGNSFMFLARETGRSYGLWKLRDGSDSTKRIRSIP